MLLLAAVHCFCANLVEASSGGALVHSGGVDRTNKPRLKPPAHFNYRVPCDWKATLFACCADRLGVKVHRVHFSPGRHCLAIWVGSGAGCRLVERHPLGNSPAVCWASNSRQFDFADHVHPVVVCVARHFFALVRLHRCFGFLASPVLNHQRSASSSGGCSH